IVAVFIFPSYSRDLENLNTRLIVFRQIVLPFMENPPCLYLNELNCVCLLNLGGLFAIFLKNRLYDSSRRCNISCVVWECSRCLLTLFAKCFCILFASTYFPKTL